MEQLLTIAGTVAAVQLLLAAWREWRSARRIVAVGGLDADYYEEHGCVPLQFAGSRFGAVRAAVTVTGFFMVRPTTPKQVFAARNVVGMRGSSEIDYRQIRPRDRLWVMLDEGEYRKVFDRSIRRGVVSFYRTVAIRELAGPGSSEYAHCVTVRTRGSVVRVAGDAGSQWLEYAVTAAAPRSNRRSGQHPLADVPGRRRVGDHPTRHIPTGPRCRHRAAKHGAARLAHAPQPEPDSRRGALRHQVHNSGRCGGRCCGALQRIRRNLGSCLRAGRALRANRIGGRPIRDARCAGAASAPTHPRRCSAGWDDQPDSDGNERRDDPAPIRRPFSSWRVDRRHRPLHERRPASQRNRCTVHNR